MNLAEFLKDKKMLEEVARKANEDQRRLVEKVDKMDEDQRQTIELAEKLMKLVEMNTKDIMTEHTKDGCVGCTHDRVGEANKTIPETVPFADLVREWAAQGRSEEEVWAVINFLTGTGRRIPVCRCKANASL